jgi:glycosyltransferase involved in cell wall biosynthesis
MKLLVLQQTYPSALNPYSQMWSHTRSKAYLKQGAQVKVVSFSELESRVYEGVEIFPIRFFKDLCEWSDVVLAHQPNLKLHFRHLFQLRKVKIVYFIHGHEVMFVNEDYSAPFSFSRDAFFLNRVGRFFYDRLKVRLLRLMFFKHSVEYAGFVFVSDWMKSLFEHRVNMSLDMERFKYRIIPNSISDYFLDKQHVLDSEIYADFIAIRHWDWSKHGVDLILESACKNPDKTYHIYGKGELPKFIRVPNNVKMIEKFLTPETIPSLLNHYRCAILPTRVDSQGVMACEMASYGMPLITSDIPVAREFLSAFENVDFISNGCWFSELTIPPRSDGNQGRRYSSVTLCSEELGFFEYLKSMPVVK